MNLTKTILQIVPALDAGGAERTTVEIAQAIVAAGGRALVATKGGRLCADVERAGGVVVAMPVDSKNPVVMAANTRRLQTLIRREKVDLLHVRSRAPAWSALAASRLSKIPLVATYHGAYEAKGGLKRFYNSAMVRADRVIANSRFTAASISAQYEIESAKMRLIPRGADLSQFCLDAVSAGRRDALRQEWGLKPGDFTVLLPARITPWKGHEVALRAAERLKSVGTGFAPNLQLIFAGDAQAREGYLAQLRGEISRRGVSSMIRFVGHCDDMPAAYCVADAVLSASTRPEAFGRTIAEAGAMERVVIAADHGGAREIVEDATTGILFPTGDDAALAEAIEGIARTPAAERAEMGARARRRIAEKFSLDAMQRATLEVYGELLS